MTVRKVAAGAKTGLYLSYDGGVNWTGPCATNGFSTQRQDITGLELTDMGGGVTRILAAVGVRGFATTVQFDLGNNGANGHLQRDDGLQRLSEFHFDSKQRQWVRLWQRGNRQRLFDWGLYECWKRVAFC